MTVPKVDFNTCVNLCKLEADWPCPNRRSPAQKVRDAIAQEQNCKGFLEHHFALTLIQAGISEELAVRTVKDSLGTKGLFDPNRCSELGNRIANRTIRCINPTPPPKVFYPEREESPGDKPLPIKAPERLIVCGSPAELIKTIPIKMDK